MSSRTPGEAIKEFSQYITAENLFEKYDEVLGIIEGPLAVAKDKLNTVDS